VFSAGGLEFQVAPLVSILMTFSDLERRGVGGQNFLADHYHYARTVSPSVVVKTFFSSRGQDRDLDKMNSSALETTSMSKVYWDHQHARTRY